MVDGPVLIVGCGVFGLSTALELVRQGHFVHIIDKFEPPSPWSAANDFNKIIRCEFSSPLYLNLSIEAMKLWRTDELYKKSFNECGRILVTSLSDKNRAEFEQNGNKMIEMFRENQRHEIYRGGRHIHENFPFLDKTSIALDQEVEFSPDSGLANASQTLIDVYKYLASHSNVTFTFGKSGNAVGVKKYTDGTVGVVTESGFEHNASYVVLSAGANTGSILNLENQQSATGLFVTHIKLTSKEYEKYKNTPIVVDGKMGCFFPPDPKTKIMKICVNGLRVKRTVSDPFQNGKDISLPRFHNDNPLDTMPKESVWEHQTLLRKYVPELANHDFFGSKICWIAEREGSTFLIDKVPGYENLYVATGDSGHGFKFFPNIGKYIIQMINGTLDSKISDAWKWKSKSEYKVKSDIVDVRDVDFLVESIAARL